MDDLQKDEREEHTAPLIPALHIVDKVRDIRRQEKSNKSEIGHTKRHKLKRRKVRIMSHT